MASRGRQNHTFRHCVTLVSLISNFDIALSLKSDRDTNRVTDKIISRLSIEVHRKDEEFERGIPLRSGVVSVKCEVFHEVLSSYLPVWHVLRQTLSCNQAGQYGSYISARD